MGAFSIWHWTIVLLVTLFWLWPTCRIIQKAGFSGWWVLVTFIPIANLIAFFVFAFATWPVEGRGVPRIGSGTA